MGMLQTKQKRPTPGLAFEHLNLRFNPFGELPRCERRELAVVDLDTLPQSLAQSRVAVQFLGDHGRGKSTHLIALHARFPDAPYTKVEIEESPMIKSALLQFVDSFDLLSERQRKRVLRCSGSVAFTTHRDLTSLLDRHGFTVITREISQTEPARVAQARQAVGGGPFFNGAKTRTR